MRENRHGLVVEACVTQAGTRAEREAALEMLASLLKQRKTDEELRELTMGQEKLPG